jgi:hypothetical protein
VALDYTKEDNILAAQQVVSGQKLKYREKMYLRIESAPGKYYMVEQDNPQIRAGTAEMKDGKIVYKWALPK